jgi:hypothetical protein
MLDQYYPYRGWDSNGIPTREKLDELSLSDMADACGIKKIAEQDMKSTPPAKSRKDEDQPAIN